MPLIKTALSTSYDTDACQQTAHKFRAIKDKTFIRDAQLKSRFTEWNVQKQYEGHSQLFFRIRDQFGNGVKHFDITFKSRGKAGRNKKRLESLIEDRRGNKNHHGTITFYLRTQEFKLKKWNDLHPKLMPVDIEITGSEPLSDDIDYVPLNIHMSTKQVSSLLKNFETTIIDIQLVRLPSQKVFAIKRA